MVIAVNKNKETSKMEKHRLVGMVTTNRNIKAVFTTEGQEVPPREMGFPVVGVALVEDMAGQQCIKIMYTGNKGLVEYLEQDKEEFIELRPGNKGLNMDKAV